MKKITDIKLLFKELDIPGILGLEHNGTIEQVNKEVVNHAPLIQVIQAFNQGKIYQCQN